MVAIVYPHKSGHITANLPATAAICEKESGAIQVWTRVFFFHPLIHLLADALALPVRNAYAAILCFSPGGIRSCRPQTPAL
jgi:hypothetical protein